MMNILVIGAGVCGLGPAWKLAQRGHNVIVFEKHHAGYGASGAAAGMLAPTAEIRFEELELLELGQESLELWPEFVRELEACSGVELDYRREGTLVLGLNRDDLEAIERLHTYHKKLDLEVHRLSAEQARELEPALTPSVSGALSIPGDHQVDAQRVVEALVEALARAGGHLRERTEVAAILHHGGRINGVKLADGSEITGDAVILAAGAWSRHIDGLKELDRPFVCPVKGQSLSLDLGKPPLCRHVIRTPDVYLVPKSCGQLVVGATMEDVGWDTEKTAGAVFDLLRGAWEVLPGIYDRPLLDIWSGFRPMTLDGLPIMRHSDTIDGLVYSFGHGRNGILLTPITANRVSALF